MSIYFDKTGATMEKIVNVTGVSGEGLNKLLGEVITMFCMNYIDTGTLVGRKQQYRVWSESRSLSRSGSWSGSRSL